LVKGLPREYGACRGKVDTAVNYLEKYDRSLAGRVIGRKLIFFRRATKWWMDEIKLKVESCECHVLSIEEIGMPGERIISTGRRSISQLS
jgi:hypothetical protein